MNLQLLRLKDVCDQNGWTMEELVSAIESGLVQEEIDIQIKSAYLHKEG